MSLELCRAECSALAPILALHSPQERCHDGSGEWSVTREDWDRDYDDEEPETFLICSECGPLEMRAEQGDDDQWASYLAALWPCSTARALGVES